MRSAAFASTALFAEVGTATQHPSGHPGPTSVHSSAAWQWLTLATNSSNSRWTSSALGPQADTPTLTNETPRISRNTLPPRGPPVAHSYTAAVSVDRTTEATEPRPTIPTLLARAVAQFGEHTYLITPTERISYREIDRRSARAARWLLHRGAGKGTRVGLFFPNDIDFVVWWLAAARVGALVVPLSTLYAPAEIAKVLRLADVALLITPPRVLTIDVAQRLEAALPGLAGQQAGRLSLPAVPYLRDIVFTGPGGPAWAGRYSDTDPLAPQEILAAVENEVSPADLVVMVHTSGSTADPKGVLHTHGTVVRQTSTWPEATA